jgi:hypothetical protein
MTMKLFLMTIALAALTGGLAQANNYNAGDCAHPNSQACKNDEAAFAKHHDGKTPAQWRQRQSNNQWYQGHQGRWQQQNNDWHFRGESGDQYSRGHNGWGWSRAERRHDRDDDRD